MFNINSFYCTEVLKWHYLFFFTKTAAKNRKTYFASQFRSCDNINSFYCTEVLKWHYLFFFTKAAAKNRKTYFASQDLNEKKCKIPSIKSYKKT